MRGVSVSIAPGDRDISLNRFTGFSVGTPLTDTHGSLGRACAAVNALWIAGRETYVGWTLFWIGRNYSEATI